MSDKNTKEKLLIAAKEEFMEKGYMKASLRNICKKAELTTGALYFFFKDKNDLFGELFREPVKQLSEIMLKHYEYESNENLGIDNHFDMEFTDDYEKAQDVLKVIYDNFDAFYLLLVKAEGSAYENLVNDVFISSTEKHYRCMMDKMAEMKGLPKVDDYMLHWISHLEIEAFERLVEQKVPREEAEKQLTNIITFMIHGFMGLFT